ncbi:hypothetical protein vBBceHLY2_00078 [Bacillus phage vB_BceH_LY2]|nr:hypothetical protein vBBceHLY2_00078 [Bacillus phage vB_BceH_LY2]
MNFELTKTIYIVFERLSSYYDDNDSAFVIAMDNEEDANEYVKSCPQHNYYVEKEHVYKIKGRG